MKPFFRLSWLVFGLCAAVMPLGAATVNWTGAAGDSLWHNAANWSGNVVPGANDDVVIGGTGQVIFNTGSVAVKSVQSTRNLQVDGGTLTVTAGASSIQGTLTLKSGYLVARGASTVFTGAGSVIYLGTDVSVSQGAAIVLTGLTQFALTETGDARFIAADAGSRIDLPNLTSASLQDFYRLRIWAEDGAKVSAPKLNQVGCALDLYASDPNSVIDLSGLPSLVRNPSAGTTRIEARSGASILMPNVTALDKVDLILRGSGLWPTGQLQTVANGSLTLDAVTNNFPSLTNLPNTSLTLANGARVTLLGITSLLRTNQGAITLSVDGANSVLDLPNLTEVTTPDYYQLELFTYRGGEIRVPKLAKMNGALEAYADGSGSAVVLTGFQGGLTNVSHATSSIEARGGGRVTMPGVTAFHRVNLTLRGTGTASIGQIKSFYDSSLTIEGQTAAFPLLTNIDATSVEVSGGGQLTLDGVTRLARAIDGSLHYSVSDAGSRLTFPNVTEAAVADYYLLELLAYSGGQLSLPRLSAMRGAINIMASGAGSVVNLPAFAGTLNNSGPGGAYLEARGGGQVLIPGVTELKRINLTLRGAGSVSLAQLTSFVDAQITLTDHEENLTALVNLGGSSISLEEGARLTLPGVTEVSRVDRGTITFSVQDAGSMLTLPSLTQATMSDYYQFELLAYSGGRISLPAFRTINGALDVLANGDGSVVDLPALTGTLANRTPGAAYLEARNGGAVLIPNVTTLDKYYLTLRGTGAIPTAQLTGIRNSTVLVDGKSVVFAGLSDTAGTTFKYENGGTAVFQPPTDLIVSTIRVPNSIVANQLVEVAWEISNIGTAFTNGVWTDTLYLSSDAVAGGDEVLGTVQSTASLASGAKWWVTNKVSIPARYAGAQYLVVGANTTRSLFEGLNYGNNTNVSGAVAVLAPDLTVQGAAVQPGAAQFGKVVTVSWTVKNGGTQAAPGNSTDRVVLVKSVNEMNSGIVITNVPNAVSLAPNATYNRSVPVSIPVVANFEDGNYFIAIVADYFGAVAEGVETNNTAFIPITLARPPLPDLAVNRFLAPAVAKPGQRVELTWVTTNQGTAAAEGVWSESIFLASTNGPITNQFVATFDFTNTLAVGAAQARTQQVVIPEEARAGNARFVVQVDATAQVPEKVETNNAAGAAQVTVIQPVLTLNLPAATISEAAVERNLAALVNRNGDWSAPLTVTLRSSDPRELTAPATISFRAGDVSAPLALTVQRDNIPDNNKEVTVTATAEGYEPGTAKVTVVNADIPKLALKLAVPSLSEGEATDLTVSHDGQFVVPITVNLSATGDGQIALPSTVTIPAGQNFVVVEVGAEDDTRLEADRSYTIRAAAAGFVAAAAPIEVLDNDLPQFTFVVASTNLSEGAGAQATLGTISRGTASPRSMTVEIENSNPGALAVPTSVVIPSGAASVSFPLGAVDNNAVEGKRTAVLKAYALTTVSGERIAQTPPVTMNILDDDGPTLTVTISHELVAEGVPNAAQVTISRNTAATQPVLVNLTSSLPTEATVPATVTIAQGAASASVTLASREDGVTDGSKAVVITAAAAGYTSGSASVIVTDTKLPDLVAREVSGPDTAETEAFVNVGYRIYNQGLATAGTNWVTKIYLSDDAVAGNDTLLNEYAFNGNLPVGQFFGQTRQVRMPQTPGKYWVIVETDTAGQIDEVLEQNNLTISAQPITLNTAYTATVIADLETAQAGTPIPLHGTAVKSSTGGAAPFALVNIHIQVRGTKRVISALADEAGRFAAVFKPLPGEAGFYEIGAAHPGAASAPIQDSFTLFGLKAGEVGAVALAENSSAAGQFTLQNPGDRALTQLNVSVASKPANLQVTATVSTNTIVGLGGATAGFTITATDASVPAGTVELLIRSAQGAEVKVPIAVTVDALRAKLLVKPSELVRGMKVGAQTLVEFDVINEGGVATGPIDVALPDAPWMRIATVAPLPSLAPHSSNRVTLQLTPPANLTLGAYEGRIALTAGNASLLVPYSFRALSEAKGDLLITAVDEYTYFAEGSPKVAGAVVVVRDAVNLQVVANGVTDAQGRFLLRNIQEGYYELELKADKHTSFREPHLILAGQTNEVQAFLRREAVRYIWKVVPTEIQDRTRITIETVFEAFVPMPVITVEPPLIDLADFTAEVTQLDMKVVNHGLIAAKEAKISFAQHPDWSIEPLVEELGDIPARGSFTIPVIIRRLSPGVQRQSGRVHALAGGCSIAGSCQFVVECGGAKLGGGADVPVINASASGNCGGGGGGSPGGKGGGGRAGGGASGGGPASSSATISSCNKCILELFKCALDLALPDLASCAKDLYGCQGAIRSGDAGQSAYECMKASINCAVAAGKESLGPIGKGIDIAECLSGVPPACFPGPGGGGGGGGDDDGGGGTDTGLVATLRRQSLRAASISGVSRVPRGEFAVVFQRLGWVLDEISPFRYILGDDVWFQNGEPAVAAAWLRSFLQRIEKNTDGGGKVSSAELTQLLGTKLPVAITAEKARTWVERWNRSLDYWAAGITNTAQVPAGQNTDFIDLDLLRAYSTASNDSFVQSATQGYATPDVALSRAREELMQFMSEGGGGGVCAQVRLRLEQEAVMTRDAFDAGLEIINDSSDTLENVAVEISVRRRTGEDATELFAIRPPVLKDLNAIDGTGTVAANSTGKISWTLVPTTDTALHGPEEFLVGGTLRYRQNGELNVTVPLAPSSITVLPSPSLAVKYFHERQVFADDPFTVEIEPSVPYSLAVMVLNKGRGAAREVHIDSAQPKIVENEKGLLADFKIIATQVEEESLQPSLSVDFGRIDPGTNTIGRWLLTSTILGGFIEYSAAFEHLDELDNKKLSLVEGVEIHELIHIVRAPGAADDGRPDFLVNDIPDLYDRPDTLHLSDGSVRPVSVVLEGKTDRVPSAGNLQVQLTVSMPAGFTYARVPDGSNGKFRLNRVVRSDGVELPFGDNAWTTDRTFLGNARRPIVENMIHLFDYNSTGQYTLYYVPVPAGDEVKPASAVAQLPAESAALFPVQWAGQDNAGGSGISFYDVYVSVDNGPFNLWISQTIDRSAIYQGGLGRSYGFYSIATDQAGNREEAPAGADARTTVTRTNHAPTLELITDQVVREGQILAIQPVALDVDGDELIYSLNTNGPVGVVINPYTGKITWATTEGSGPKSYTFTVQVLDSGLPRLGATRSFVVTVSDENTPPIITAVAPRTVSEGQALTFTAVANDIDLPAQAVSFSLAGGAPAGATIQTNGLFNWRPNDFQGGQTYAIGIVARDDGAPSMSSTQTVTVTVRDTRSDVIVTVGTTNVIAGGTITVPITLTSGADLGSLAFDLKLEDPHLPSVELSPAGGEVASSALEFIDPGYYRIRIELDPARAQAGTRAVGTLRFETRVDGHSSSGALAASGLQAVRQTGESIARTTLGSGRIFVIENEPLLDTAIFSASLARLVFYAKPGTQLLMEETTDLRNGGTWVEATGLTMSTTFHLMNVPLDNGAKRFFHLKRVN